MLPRLNEHPKYSFLIPSTGKTARFRPYLVKEEKILLSAFESKDRIEGIRAIGDTVLSCMVEDADVSDLTLFDVEYLFTKIRSKSVGETASVTLKCQECKADNPIEINVDNIEAEHVPARKTLEIADDVTVVVSHPMFLDVVAEKALGLPENSNEYMMALVRTCLKELKTAEGRFDLTEESKEEVEAFIGSLNRQQFKKIRDHIRTGPSLTFHADFNCQHCSHENHLKIEDIRDFF